MTAIGSMSPSVPMLPAQQQCPMDHADQGASVATSGGGPLATDQAALGAEIIGVLQQLVVALEALVGALGGAGQLGSAPETTGGGPAPKDGAPPKDDAPTKDAAPAKDAAAATGGGPAKPALDYTVAEGDTLGSIAKRAGVADWKSIYDLNKDVVGKDPNNITPGMQLKLPDGASKPGPTEGSKPKGGSGDTGGTTSTGGQMGPGDTTSQSPAPADDAPPAEQPKSEPAPAPAPEPQPAKPKVYPPGFIGPIPVDAQRAGTSIVQNAQGKNYVKTTDMNGETTYKKTPTEELASPEGSAPPPLDIHAPEILTK